jgi:predicted nucleic acid-binding protein
LVGANTFGKKDAITKIFKTYYGIPVNSLISEVAVHLMLKFISGQKIISVPDCLIAASSIVTGLPLHTYNKKDFDFIDGIQLY